MDGDGLVGRRRRAHVQIRLVTFAMVPWAEVPGRAERGELPNLSDVDGAVPSKSPGSPP